MNACGNSAWALSGPVILTCVVCLGVLLLARWVTRQRYFSGRESFIVLHLASLWWMAAASLEMAAQGPQCKVFWATMAWPGILVVPTFWAVFLWQYVNSVRQPLPLRSTLGLSVAPLLIWLMALSRVDVTLAYPMLAIGYVINAFAAQHFLNEPVSMQRWIAIGVIVLGVALLARS